MIYLSNMMSDIFFLDHIGHDVFVFGTILSFNRKTMFERLKIILILASNIVIRIRGIVRDSSRNYMSFN